MEMAAFPPTAIRNQADERPIKHEIDQYTLPTIFPNTPCVSQLPNPNSTTVNDTYTRGKFTSSATD